MDDERPRRRRVAAAPIAIERDPNPLMRVLLHSPKDTIAGPGRSRGRGVHHHQRGFSASEPPSVSDVQWIVRGRCAVATASRCRGFVQPMPRPPRLSPRRQIRSRAKSKPAPIANPSAVTPRPPLPVPNAKRTDPVGDLIKSSRRAASVQRVLSEYGYGQLKPTGIIGPDTQVAIQKFERERKMPVTGQLSDRLVHDLGVLAGRPLD